jgi:hypothetical protein
MVNVFPAESTRSASIWSSRVSTPATGVTTVRMEGMVTVMYITVAETNATVTLRVFFSREEFSGQSVCKCEERVHPLRIKRGRKKKRGGEH